MFSKWFAYCQSNVYKINVSQKSESNINNCNQICNKIVNILLINLKLKHLNNI